MPSIRKPYRTKKKSWATRVEFCSNQRRVSHHIRHPNKATLMVMAAQMAEDFEAGLFDPFRDVYTYNPKRGEETLSELVDRYIGENNWKWTPNSAYQVSYYLNRLLDSLGGDRWPEIITEQSLNEFINNPGWSHGTRASVLTTIKVFAGWLAGQGILDSAPVLENRARKKDTSPKYITPDEIRLIKKKLIAYVRSAGPQQRARKSRLSLIRIINFLFWTGLRPSDALNIRLRQVDRQNWKIRLTIQKTNTEEELLIVHPALRRLISAQIRDLKKEGKAGPQQRLLDRSHHGRLARSFKELLKMALPPHRAKELQLYSLRHGHATYLINKGLSLHQVGASLYHKDLRSTQKYAKIQQRDLRDRISRAFSEEDS